MKNFLVIIKAERIHHLQTHTTKNAKGNKQKNSFSSSRRKMRTDENVDLHWKWQLHGQICKIIFIICIPLNLKFDCLNKNNNATGSL